MISLTNHDSSEGEQGSVAIKFTQNYGLDPPSWVGSTVYYVNNVKPSGKHTKNNGKPPSLSSVHQLFLCAIFQ